MRQFQSKKFTKRNSKKNSKYSQNMRGGASGSASGSRRFLPTIPVHSAMSGAMSSDDNNKLLFEAILHNGDRFNLNPDVFEQHPNSKTDRQIKEKFRHIINNEYNNDRGQTALYVVLRFNPTILMIKMLLEVPGINVNRTNNTTQSDGSTPLMGLCFSNKIFKWKDISEIIRLLCYKGADLTLTNTNGESALKLLENRSIRKGLDKGLDKVLLDFTE